MGVKTQGWDYIKNEFISIDKVLERKIDAFLIGGSAMSYYGIKDATKDIDVLFRDGYDCAVFFNALMQLGYETSEQYFPPVIQMEATFFIYKDDEIWMDLFIKNVMNKFELSPSIEKRAVKIDISTEKLRIYCLNPNDIFLFKSITPRERDEDDLILLLTHGEIDFDIIHEEINYQSRKYQDIKMEFNRKMRKLEERGYYVEYI